MTNSKKENKEGENNKSFFQKHFLTFFLIFLLLLSVAWGFLTNKITERRYENTLSELHQKQEQIIDSINIAKTEALANTLALAVRSEMIANRSNQLEQYLIQSLKNLNVRRILLADPQNGKVLLSTDKKDNGTLFKNRKLLDANEVVNDTINKKRYVATPIMGLNQQLATLIVQMD